MLDLDHIRLHFPALSRTHNGQPIIYLDGPGGTQVTRSCIEAMADYLSRCNANHGGAFVTSAESDAIVHEAHEVMADFLNAARAEEIIFGQNMTSLTFAMSRSIGQTIQAGDEIILTRLDHDANYSPWHLMAQERGAVVRVVDINADDCTLNMDDFERFLGPRTKLVAVGYASNAVGTINPVKQIIEMAKAAGALTYIDAVHYAPHGPIDVQELGCDFLVCSPYKFFAPHLGTLYGRHALLESLPAYKVRPASARPPHKFETGTQSHESMAGLIGTMQYLEWLGNVDTTRASPADDPAACRSPRAAALRRAMNAIRSYEHTLKIRLLNGLSSIPGIRIYGITEATRLAQRAPTFAIRITGHPPRHIAQRLAERGICVWDGNYYALNLTERLGVESSGGMVRIGPVHYNTSAEIDRLLTALEEIAAGA
ncbi:MAG: cysteine desulfurase-like protein [Anaerolineae bacterium]|nr:cysteine desulfurase-like protein [Thermoflexales bacterium]MDW8407832.1 cysteine desulfurase-like protein [Anaerolineae bacterium]